MLKKKNNYTTIIILYLPILTIYYGTISVLIYNRQTNDTNI